MLKRLAMFKVTTLGMGLFVSSVQADDVSVKNVLDQPSEFRVIILSTGFDRTISLKPGETVNAIGTDLWHNAVVTVYGHSPSGTCALVVSETELPQPFFFPPFYLPKVSGIRKYPPCQHTSNVPVCCFTGTECMAKCQEVSNAKVVISNQFATSGQSN